jgi:hypothetical protein
MDSNSLVCLANVTTYSACLSQLSSATYQAVHYSWLEQDCCVLPVGYAFKTITANGWAVYYQVRAVLIPYRKT